MLAYKLHASTVLAELNLNRCYKIHFSGRSGLTVAAELVYGIVM